MMRINFYFLHQLQIACTGGDTRTQTKSNKCHIRTDQWSVTTLPSQRDRFKRHLYLLDLSPADILIRIINYKFVFSLSVIEKGMLKTQKRRMVPLEFSTIW